MLLLLLGFFLAPLSGGGGINEAKAQVEMIEQIEIVSKEITKDSAKFDVRIKNIEHDSSYYNNSGLIVTLFDISNPKEEKIRSWPYSFRKSDTREQVIEVCIGKGCGLLSPSIREGKKYKIMAGIYKGSSKVEAFLMFQTGVDGSGPSTIGDSTEYRFESTDSNYGCVDWDGIDIPACIGVILHRVVFSILAGITRLVAYVLDFAIYYSTNSESYNVKFVEQGWKVVRDIANIFFIISLLYVAIKTILGLNVTDNKKIVGAVIIIGLVINFSLFTTRVVVDATNILAKIFYNNIKATGPNGEELTEGEGEKSISVALVSKFNPQTIVDTDFDVGGNTTQFLIITVLSIIMMLYLIYVFWVIAFMFISRVVSIWMYMIFSPLAFISFATPFDIPGFGHKEWWKNLLENAMLAPFFIFFLYIIIMFANFLRDITYNTKDADTMQMVMKTLIPFIIIYTLLDKAKDLTVKYAGEMGAKFATVGKAALAIAGATAGGLAIGGVAKTLQGTLGHVGKRIFENKTLTEWETNEGKGPAAWAKRFVGKNVRTVGGGVEGKGGLAGASFDVRKAVWGGAVLGTLENITGLKLGKESKRWSEAGGYAADLERQKEKQERRAFGLATKRTEDAGRDLDRVQEEHQELLQKNTVDDGIDGTKETITVAQRLKRINGRIDYYMKEAQQAKDEASLHPEDKEKKRKADELYQTVNDLKTEKKRIRNGATSHTEVDPATGATRTVYDTADGKISQKALDEAYDNVARATAEKVAADAAAVAAPGLHAAAVNAATLAGNIVTTKLGELATARTALDANPTNQLRVKEFEKAEKDLEEAQKRKAEADRKSAEALAAVTNTATAAVNANTRYLDAVDKETDAYNDSVTGGISRLTIANYENEIIPDAQDKVETISKERRRAMAKILRKQRWHRLNREARNQIAHDIMMEAKETSGGKH